MLKIKLGQLEKTLLKFGEFYLFYNDSKKETAYINNKNVEIGEKQDNLKYKLNIRDIYNEQQNDGIVGTTLVNILNKIDIIKEVLNAYLNILYHSNDDIIEKIIVDENITFSYYLLNIITTLRDELEKKIKCYTLEVIIHKIFTNFELDYNNIVFFNKDLYMYMEECREKRAKCNYYENMHNYLSNIWNKRVEKSKWFTKFSEKEMVQIFINSLITDIEFIRENCEKDIDKYPASAKNEKCKIETLLDLFYVSKYHIQQYNKKLKCCGRCNRYFITKFKSTEKYCRRKEKNYKYNCSELESKNYRGKKDLANNRRKLSIENNSICTMLRKRDNNKGTDELQQFKKRQKDKYIEIEQVALTEDDEISNKIQWLKEEHDKLKNN